MRMREDVKSLTGPDKAALLLMAIGEENAVRLFAVMEEDEIRELSQHMASLGSVSSELIEQLLVDFADQISGTGAVVGNFESTERLLMKLLDPEKVNGIMEEIRGPAGRPVDVLTSLSRLMNQGIGEGRTREDHRSLADQLYSAYAQGKDARALSAIVGEGALSDLDRKFLDVANNFEKKFVNQGIDEDRPIEQTLSIGWELLSGLSESELTRIKPEFISKYFKADTQWWKKKHDAR